MAADRFITWDKDKEKPTNEQILFILEDFLGGVGDLGTPDLGKRGGTIIVRLPGKPTNPFTRVMDREPLHLRKERFFEVLITRSDVDVLTREADFFTDGLATTFAKLLARYWGARYQDSEEMIDYGKK